MIDPAFLDCLDGVAYVVDPAGRIVSYGERRWNAFADANSAPELCEGDNVIGIALLDVVLGDDVRDAYHCLMGEILTGRRRGFAFGFRCDTPEIAREMRMAITPVLAHGEVTGILFQSIVLRSKARPPLDIFRFRDPDAAAGGTSDHPILTLCSYCQKVKAPADNGHAQQWISAEGYYRGGGRSEVQISHGMCEGCAAEIWPRR